MFYLPNLIHGRVCLLCYPLSKSDSREQTGSFPALWMWPVPSRGGPRPRAPGGCFLWPALGAWACRDQGGIRDHPGGRRVCPLGSSWATHRWGQGPETFLHVAGRGQAVSPTPLPALGHLRKREEEDGAATPL